MHSLPRLPSWLITALAVIAGLVTLFKVVDWIAQYLWFDTLGLVSVFWTFRLLKTGLFLAAFLSILAYFWANLHYLALRLDIAVVVNTLINQLAGRALPANAYRPPDASGSGLKERTPDIFILAAVVLALLFALALSEQWEALLRYVWSLPVGETDPIFGNDIGFYLFELPFLEATQNFLITATFAGAAFVLGTYAYAGALKFSIGDGIDAPPEVLKHIVINVILFLLVLAWGFYLDRFDLLQSDRGAVYGAGYTDFHVVRPTLVVVIAVTIALAGALMFPRQLGRAAVALVVVVGYPAILLLTLVVLPWGVQSFVVEPNELELEEPYLRHNIALTRRAYQLDHVAERTYEAVVGLKLPALLRNDETIDNLRLWDWRPIAQTFRQLQQIRTYYEFGDADADRYLIDGKYRQVLLSARELSEELPADTWLNRHLQYTHGYGLAMSLTSTMSEQGAPELVIKDLPPVAEGGLNVSNPAIYYGERTSEYAVVATDVPEFDYPRGDENVYASYEGRGGVDLGSFWKRLVFAWQQLDVNILLTAYTREDSRILLWRQVEERIGLIAPFLRQDQDRYIAVSDGRLFWIQDAYTVASGYPYSEPFEDDLNYIRNAVKVVVDAYHGDVEFYVVDPEDPILRVYQEALPALFTDFDEVPDDLRRHLRYPIDLFDIQAEKYNIYHMTVPQVFYNGEDMWEEPWETYGGRRIRMQPYYVLVRLPGEDRLQFLLMTPLTPRNRDNMIGWMAARSDFPGYGEVLVYKLPKDHLVIGPIQIEALINQDTDISQRLSLWDQRGSRVIRGNLLVIPIENSFIYVEPVYLISEGTDIPQLKRIIVSDGEKLAMERTLEEALEAVFGEERPRTADATVDARAADPEDLVGARAAYSEVEAALRAGDWDAFGRAMEALGSRLGE